MNTNKNIMITNKNIMITNKDITDIKKEANVIDIKKALVHIRKYWYYYIWCTLPLIYLISILLCIIISILTYIIMVNIIDISYVGILICIALSFMPLLNIMIVILGIINLPFIIGSKKYRANLLEDIENILQSLEK